MYSLAWRLFCACSVRNPQKSEHTLGRLTGKFSSETDFSLANKSVEGKTQTDRPKRQDKRLTCPETRNQPHLSFFLSSSFFFLFEVVAKKDLQRLARSLVYEAADGWGRLVDDHQAQH